MYRIESTVIKRLREQDLSIDTLLQEYAKNNRKQTIPIKVTYHIDNDVREKLIEAGIVDMEELKAALLKCFGDVDVIIEEKE